ATLDQLIQQKIDQYGISLSKIVVYDECNQPRLNNYGPRVYFADREDLDFDFYLSTELFIRDPIIYLQDSGRITALVCSYYRGQDRLIKKNLYTAHENITTSRPSRLTTIFQYLIDKFDRTHAVFY